jgi:hypothetical protein
MKFIPLYLSVYFLLFLTSCSQQVDKKSKTETLKELHSDLSGDTNHVNIFELPENYFSYMEGTIGDIPIAMVLIKNKETIAGYYYYKKIGAPLKIIGLYNDKHSFNFVESSDKYDTTGFFKGNFIDATTFIGTWNNPKKTKEFEVNLKRKDIGIEQVNYHLLTKKNCARKEKNKHKNPNDLEYWDTICSLVEINQLKIKAKDSKLNTSINKSIEKEICASYGERKNSISDVLNMVDPDPNYDTDIDEYGFDLHINCELTHVDPYTLSIVINDYSYTYGAAHPNSGQSHLNFDLSTGKLLQLDDMFSETNIKKLTLLGEKKFIQQYGSEGWDFEPGNFKLARNFSLTALGITFHYNTYEIGCYANGSPSISIPYSEIKKLMKPLQHLKK